LYIKMSFEKYNVDEKKIEAGVRELAKYYLNVAMWFADKGKGHGINVLTTLENDFAPIYKIAEYREIEELEILEKDRNKLEKWAKEDLKKTN